MSSDSRVSEAFGSTSEWRNRSSRSSAWACDSPTTVYTMGSILTDSGSRPTAAMLLLLAVVRPGDVHAGSPVKISSAQRAAKSRPRPEDPACSSTGRPCGDLGTVSGPRALNHLPS